MLLHLYIRRTKEKNLFRLGTKRRKILSIRFKHHYQSHSNEKKTIMFYKMEFSHVILQMCMRCLINTVYFVLVIVINKIMIGCYYTCTNEKNRFCFAKSRYITWKRIDN